MRNYKINEATMNAVKAARKIASQYMLITVPGVANLVGKNEETGECILLGGIEKVSTTGESLCVPMVLSTDDPEADNEEIAVLSSQFDKLLDMCVISGADILMTVDGKEEKIYFTAGEVHGSMRYFSKEKTVLNTPIELGKDPVFSMKVNTGAFLDKWKVASAFTKCAVDIRAAKDGSVRMLPSFDQGAVIICTCDLGSSEIIETNYGEKEEIIDVLIPVKYAGFLLEGIYGKEAMLTVYRDGFAWSSNMATFIGHNMERGSLSLIPDSSVKGLPAKSEEFDYNLFVDRQELSKALSIAKVWESIVSPEKGIIKLSPSSNKLEFAMSDDYANTLACICKETEAHAKQEDAQGDYHFAIRILAPTINAFGGGYVSLSFKNRNMNGKMQTIVFVQDANFDDKEKKPLLLGNKAYVCGVYPEGYVKMVSDYTILAEKDPLEVKADADRAAEKKAALKGGRRKK